MILRHILSGHGYCLKTIFFRRLSVKPWQSQQEEAVSELISEGRLQDALNAFYAMPVKPLEKEYKVCGNFFIREMMAATTKYTPQQVLQVCHQFKQKGVNVFAFQTAAEISASADTDKETTRLFINKFINECGNSILRPQYFNPVLRKCKTQEEVLEVLSNDMKHLPFSSDLMSDTFVWYVWPKCSSDFDKVVKECIELGYPMPFLFTSYVRYLLEELDLKKSLAVMRDPKYASHRIQKQALMRYIAKAAASTGTVDQILSLIKEAHDKNTEFDAPNQTGSFLVYFLHFEGQKRMLGGCSFLDSLLDKMTQKGMSISERYHDMLINSPRLTSKQIEQINLISVLSRASSLSLKANDDALPETITDLERQLNKLQNERINEKYVSEMSTFEIETRQVIRDLIWKLIMEYCRRAINYLNIKEEQEMTEVNETEDNVIPETVTRVSELLRLLKSKGISFTNPLKTILYEFYGRCGDFQSCKQMRHEMPSGFVVKDYKLLGVVQCYVKHGRVQEAISILKEDIERRKRTSYSDQEAWKEATKKLYAASFLRCLTEVAVKTRDPQAVDNFFNLCLQLRGEKPTTGMMGVKVKIHLLRDDLDAAVKQFVLLTQEYRETPLTMELMTRLIKANDMTRLEHIVNVSSEIHGKQNVSTQLAFAFLDVGKTEEASKILKKVGVAFASLRNRAELLIKRRDVDGIVKMVHVLKEVSGVDQHQLNDYLVRARSQEGIDVEK